MTVELLTTDAASSQHGAGQTTITPEVLTRFVEALPTRALWVEPINDPNCHLTEFPSVVVDPRNRPAVERFFDAFFDDCRSKVEGSYQWHVALPYLALTFDMRLPTRCRFTLRFHLGRERKFLESLGRVGFIFFALLRECPEGRTITIPVDELQRVLQENPVKLQAAREQAPKVAAV